MRGGGQFGGLAKRVLGSGRRLLCIADSVVFVACVHVGVDGRLG